MAHELPQPDPELYALAVATGALQPLGAAQRARVMRYLSNRYEQTETPDTVRVVRLLLACDDVDAEQHTDGDDRPATLTTSQIRGLLA